MAVYGPYHASHLHSLADVKKILGSSDTRGVQVLDQYKTRFSLQSTSTGLWFDKDMSANKLLMAVVHDILIEPLRIGRVLERCAETALALKSSKCRIISCAPTDLQNSFVNVVKSTTKADVVFQEELGDVSLSIPTSQNPQYSKRPRLAIVGMAGRFPNAADHEKFWELLEAGLDVHKKVSVTF